MGGSSSYSVSPVKAGESSLTHVPPLGIGFRLASLGAFFTNCAAFGQVEGWRIGMRGGVDVRELGHYTHVHLNSCDADSCRNGILITNDHPQLNQERMRQTVRVVGGSYICGDNGLVSYGQVMEDALIRPTIILSGVEMAANKTAGVCCFKSDVQISGCLLRADAIDQTSHCITLNQCRGTVAGNTLRIRQGGMPFATNECEVFGLDPQQNGVVSASYQQVGTF